MSDSAKSGIQLLDIDDPAGGLLAYSAHKGDVDDALIQRMYQRFDDANANGSKIRIYAEMEAIPSVDGSMLLDKLKRIGSIMSALERMAIVGDAGWLDLYTAIVDPLTKPDIKHFTTDQKDEALAWLRS